MTTQVLKKRDDGKFECFQDEVLLGLIWKEDGEKTWSWKRVDGSEGNGASTRAEAGLKLAGVGTSSEEDVLAPPADPEKLRRPEVAPNVEVMDTLSGVYSVKLPKAVGRKVAKLREAIQARLVDIPQKDWIRCDVCLEFSTEDVDRCPFCGDLGSDGAPVGAVEAAEPDEAEEAEVEEAAEAAESERLEGELEGEEESEGAEEEMAAHEESEALKAEVLSADEAAEAVALAERRSDLDARVERITEMKRDIAGRGWDLGQEIAAIYDAELWKARGHASFKAFVEDDLGISKSLAYDLMDASKTFKREDFLAVGQSKIVLIAKLPPGQREEALEGAKNGEVSYRDLAGKTKEANKGTETGGVGGGKRRKAKNEELFDADEGTPTEDADESGFTLLARVDAAPVTVPWRNAESGRKVSAHKRVGLVEGGDKLPDCYAELSLPEAGVVIRTALEFDEAGFLVGVTHQFLKA